jgi:alpha-L-fucosidase
VSRGGNLLLDIGPRADGRIPTIMEERLVQIGNWLKPNGEAIYGTHALTQTRQWSRGTVPRMEEKEFRADYDITKMVDTPPSGYARVDVFFTAKDDAIYAIVPRWPDETLVLDGVGGSSTAQITLLETGDALKFSTSGKQTTVTVPSELRTKLPERQLYTLKLSGFKS